MLTAHGLGQASHLEEASGVSRNDRFTARGLAQECSNSFAAYADHLHNQNAGMNKTGTIEGIRTLAGYFDTSSFVVSLPSNDRQMRLPAASNYRVRAVPHENQ